jgi:hypothetical protein
VLKKWLLETILKVAEGSEEPFLKNACERVRLELAAMQKAAEKAQRDAIYQEKAARKTIQLEKAHPAEVAKQEAINKISTPVTKPAIKADRQPKAPDPIPRDRRQIPATPRPQPAIATMPVHSLTQEIEELPVATPLAEKRNTALILSKQTDFSPVKEALDALHGNTFKEFWKEYGTYDVNTNEPAKRQDEYNLLRGKFLQYAFGNQDLKNTESTLTAIKLLVNNSITPLEKNIETIMAEQYVAINENGTKSEKDKKNALKKLELEKLDLLQTLEEIPAVQAMRKIEKAVDRALEQTKASLAR